MNTEIRDGKLVITIDLESNGARKVSQSGLNYVDFSTGRAFVKAAGNRKINMTVIQPLEGDDLSPEVKEAAKARKVAKLQEQLAALQA